MKRVHGDGGLIFQRPFHPKPQNTKSQAPKKFQAPNPKKNRRDPQSPFEIGFLNLP
jgi:hypothetical protein